MKRNSLLRLGWAASLLLSVAVASTVASTVASAGPAQGIRRIDDFHRLRADLVEMVGAATTRVWMSTEFLSDGELVSALYLAKYRRVDVKVLLGRGKAKAYMSRLPFLKRQGIPVYVMPKTFPDFGKSAILVDEKLLSINGALDFLARPRSYTIRYGTRAFAISFMKAFAQTTNQGIPRIGKPMRLAARREAAGHVAATSVRSKKGTTRRSKPRRSRFLPSNRRRAEFYKARRKEDTEGTYYYSGKSTRRPPEISGKLPKKTKTQARGAQPMNKGPGKARRPKQPGRAYNPSGMPWMAPRGEETHKNTQEDNSWHQHR